MNKGYVALTSVLVITVLIILVGTTVSLLGIDEGVSAISTKRSMETLNVATACTEEALLKVSESGQVPDFVYLPTADCASGLDVRSGYNFKFIVDKTIDQHYRHFYLDVDRGLPFLINFWSEN